MPLLLARIPATIVAGSWASTIIPLCRKIPTILEMSAAWTAAEIGIYGSEDGINFPNVYQADGTKVVLTVAEGRRITLNGFSVEAFSNHNYILLCSEHLGAGVNQVNNRVLYIELWE